MPYQRGSGYIKSVLHPMLKIVLRVERNLKRVEREWERKFLRIYEQDVIFEDLIVMYLLLSYP